MISELNEKAYGHIEEWRNRPLQGGKYPYVYVDGYREVLGATDGFKEDKLDELLPVATWQRSRWSKAHCR